MCASNIKSKSQIFSLVWIAAKESEAFTVGGNGDTGSLAASRKPADFHVLKARRRFAVGKFEIDEQGSGDDESGEEREQW
jgi:hypothetical protein